MSDGHIVSREWKGSDFRGRIIEEKSGSGLREAAYHRNPRVCFMMRPFVVPRKGLSYVTPICFSSITRLILSVELSNKTQWKKELEVKKDPFITQNVQF